MLHATTCFWATIVFQGICDLYTTVFTVPSTAYENTFCTRVYLHQTSVPLHSSGHHQLLQSQNIINNKSHILQRRSAARSAKANTLSFTEYCLNMGSGGGRWCCGGCCNGVVGGAVLHSGLPTCSVTLISVCTESSCVNAVLSHTSLLHCTDCICVYVLYISYIQYMSMNT